MTLFGLVLRTLRHRRLSCLAAILSLALGCALMSAVVTLRSQTHERFTRVGLGVDAILAPKGSPLQITLCSLYHLEDMPGKIPWPLVEELRRSPVVEAVIPFCTGHSFGGVRVNAVDRSFFEAVEVEPGVRLGTRPERGGSGRLFGEGGVDEAVAGWEAARTLRLSEGQAFNPSCGSGLWWSRSVS